MSQGKNLMRNANDISVSHLFFESKQKWHFCFDLLFPSETKNAFLFRFTKLFINMKGSRKIKTLTPQKRNHSKNKMNSH